MTLLSNVTPPKKFSSAIGPSLKWHANFDVRPSPPT